MHKITNIVLTGGPCAGKTTAIAYLTQKLEEMGYAVLAVPEAATLCITGGIHPASELVGLVTAQKAIAQTTRHLSNIFMEVAEKLAKKKPVVIIYDRGLRDGMAYMQHEDFKRVIESIGIDPVSARDSVYDAVIHMRTSADGASEFYTLDNNEARYETAEQAIAQDDKLIDVWLGHSHFRVIDNSTDFAGKLHRVMEEVCHVLGVPVPLERERKFLVDFDASDIPSNAQVVEIEQAYLTSPDPDVEIRIRRRGQDGVYQFYKTIKRPHPSGKASERWEVEEPISASQYGFGMEMRDPRKSVIRKTRTCFLFESQYFELDQFESLTLPEGKAILEIELTDENADVEIPEWIHVLREVTEEAMFKNKNLAAVVS